MKNKIMPTLVLAAICLVVAFSLAMINEITAPIIKDAQNQASNAALLEVLPNGENFEEIALDEQYPPAITMGYKADGGCVFQATVSGKNSGLIIMIGISDEGKIVGTKVIADQETDDYDVKVFPLVSGTEGAYKDMTLDSFEPVLVAGATLTSKAYSEAIKASLQAFAIAGGGSVDIRTPEQILQDNCNAALGTNGVTFTRWFATEVIEGIDAVYEAEDNSGRVFVIGETFVGIKADGSIVGSSAEADKILAANVAVSGSALTEITELPEEVTALKSVKKIFVTESGNYVFELEAKGYQALFDYGNGTPIQIKLSISADGKIIDCLTVSHAESQGYGDACATEEYYNQYRGENASDVKPSVSYTDAHADQISPDNTDIGAISSATFTTYGYQKAVKEASVAFNLLTANEGGNQ